MLRTIVMAFVIMSVVLCRVALAHDHELGPHLLVDTKNSQKKNATENTRPPTGVIGILADQKKDLYSIIPILNQFEVMDGRFTLYSRGDGKIRLEFGLSGYLGIKWRF